MGVRRETQTYKGHDPLTCCWIMEESGLRVNSKKLSYILPMCIFIIYSLFWHKIYYLWDKRTNSMHHTDCSVFLSIMQFLFQYYNFRMWKRHALNICIYFTLPMIQHMKKKREKKTRFYKISSRKRSFYKNKCKIKFSNGMKKRKENNITNEILYAWNK